MGNNNTAVKKVPIRIVHSESAVEKGNYQYLLQSDTTTAEAEGLGVTGLSSLVAPDQDYAVFRAVTRHRDPDSTQAAQTGLRPQKDTDTNTHDSQQPLQPADQSSSNRMALKPGVSEEDQKREELARDIMGKDKSLADILDQSKMKTTMDMMEGIFPQGQQLLEGAHQRRKVPSKHTASRPAEERSGLLLSFTFSFVVSSTGGHACISDLPQFFAYFSVEAETFYSTT